MKNPEFGINLTDTEALKVFFKNSKTLFVRVAVGTINNLAYSMRQKYIDEIDDRMTVRNEKFVSSRMRVTRAKGRDLNSIEAQVGSISSPRFSGWAEQERGDKPNNNRTITSFGRVGADDQRQAKGKARAKTNNKFAKISDYTIRAKSRKHRLIIFLQKMTEEKRTFVMPRKYKGLKRGVYFVKGKRLKRVQTFGPRKVKINKWMEPVNKQLKQKEIAKEWKKSLNHFMPRTLPR